MLLAKSVPSCVKFCIRIGVEPGARFARREGERGLAGGPASVDEDGVAGDQ